MSVGADVDDTTRDVLAGVAIGDLKVLDEVLAVREAAQAGSGLDPRTFALVNVATLIALDAPTASYLWQVAGALEAGATPQDLLGVLRAVAPQVGAPRAMAAAPELMLALGLALPDESPLDARSGMR
jgi:4-carboxymuconolactone decarboxylase